MNDKNNPTLPPTNMEPDTGYEPLAKEKATGLDPRLDITVISYRRRNHDPDGISIKAALDGIVRAGLLRDDSTKEIRKITYKSIITKGEEKTVIEIDEPRREMV